MMTHSASSNSCCETKVSNVRNRYLPLKKLPTTAAEIDKIADDMFQQCVRSWGSL
jgi:hypothetical protein